MFTQRPSDCKHLQSQQGGLPTLEVDIERLVLKLHSAFSFDAGDALAQGMRTRLGRIRRGTAAFLPGKSFLSQPDRARIFSFNGQCAQGSMSRSLVTGAAGFLGSHVARHCLEMGHEVVALDDLSGGFRDNVPQDATFVHGSIVDHKLIDHLFREHHFDYVYHLAAYAAEGLSHFIRRFNYTNNVVGSINLINASVRHEVSTFVFTSSIAVYGGNQLPLSEDLTPRPEDPYGVAKYAVELDLHCAHEMFGLDYIVFRPHNVYGEHQNIGDRYRNVVGIFMNQAMSGHPLTIFGDGEQTRAFSYVDDVAPLIAGSVGVPAARNETFNVGADTPYSVNSLASVVCAAFNVDSELRYLPSRNEVLHAYASHEKISTVFGTREPVLLETGIARMAEWARSIGPRATPLFKGIEVDRNLPEIWRASLTAPNGD